MNMNTKWLEPNGIKKRIAVCISVPVDYMQFSHLCEAGTNFIQTLAHKYATDNVESLWLRYQPTAKVLNDCATALRQEGVKVIERFDGSQWERLRGADVVVFFAHRDNELSRLELFDKVVGIDDFTTNIERLFPKEYSGTIDLHSCYSEDIVERLKDYFVHRHILMGTCAPVSAALLAILLPEIVKYMRIRKVGYIEAFDFIYKKAIESKRHQETSRGDSDLPTLGRKANCSTVAAPTEAERGNSFSIQVSLHAERDEKTVVQMARQRDGQSVKRDQTKLSFKLRKNDKVQIRLQIMNNQDGCFAIIGSSTPSDHTHETIYNGSINTVFFNVNIDRKCQQNSCLCRVLLYSNQQDLGEMQFTVRITDGTHTAQIIDESGFQVKTRDDYNKAARQKLQDELEKLRQKLLQEIDAGNDINKHSKLLKIIDKCLYLIDEYKIDKIANSVFISSTNDLNKERQAVKEGLNAARKTPIMSEYWNAEDITPIDVCCREVLKSDYFICIVGERYGYVEPSICLSMTKIEYLVANCSNMARFIFIHKDLLEKIDRMDENMSEQYAFIKEIKQEKFINIYSDEQSLKSGTELAILQYER